MRQLENGSEHNTFLHTSPLRCTATIPILVWIRLPAEISESSVLETCLGFLFSSTSIMLGCIFPRKLFGPRAVIVLVPWLVSYISLPVLLGSDGASLRNSLNQREQGLGSCRNSDKINILCEFVSMHVRPNITNKITHAIGIEHHTSFTDSSIYPFQEDAINPFFRAGNRTFAH